MTIFKFALLRIVRNPLSIILGFIIPLALLLVPGMWREDGRGYYWIVFTLLLSAFPLTRGLQTDMKERVVMRVMSTPTTTLTYLWQNLAASMTPLVIQIVLICVFGIMRYEWAFEKAGLLAVMYLLFSMTAIGLAYAWSFLFKKSEGETGSAVMMTLMIFSSTFGIMMPADSLSGMMETIAMLFPTYWASTGIDALLSTGSYGVDLLLPMGVLVLFTAIFLLYGSKRGAY